MAAADTGLLQVAAPTVSRAEPPQLKLPEPPARQRAAYAWVQLLVRIYEVLPLLCPRCGSAMRLIAFITRTEAITPPPLAPRARAPPALDFADSELGTLDQAPPWDLSAAPIDPGYEFDHAARA